MKRHKISHLDHGLTDAQIKFIFERFGDHQAFLLKTIELPAELGTVPCGLYGPTMGDEPVPESQVHYQVRGERKGESRMVRASARPSRLVTVIAGMYEDEPCILYTAFGGPASPKEPWDCNNDPESVAFWAEHALAE